MKHALEVRNVSHWFGSFRVLHEINLNIGAGQIVALVGPSGCGKSTLLRAILGTHPPKAGHIFTNGHAVCGPNRDVGIVYQHYSLFDFLTARQNVACGLMLDQTSLPYRAFNWFGWSRLRRRHLQEAGEFLKKVHLPHAADRYPHELSGGMRQRVAIAQALIMEPQILLLDEPFGALDEATREDLQGMLLELYAENLQTKQRGETPRFTIMIVTHELNEALYVADRVIGLSRFYAGGDTQGAMIVYDKPAPVFKRDDPRDFVAFTAQKEELRKAVFDPTVLQPAEQYVTSAAESAE